MFLSCACVCRCRGCCSLSVYRCVCDLLIFLQVIDITLTDEQRNRPETTPDGPPDPQRDGRMLRLVLADGSQYVSGFEYQRINSLSGELVNY